MPQDRVLQRDAGGSELFAARTLVTRRTDLVALVLPEPTTRVFSADRFFSGVIHGVSQELEAADKQLVLMLAGSPASYARIERSVAAHHVDGVLLSSLHGDDPLPAALTAIGVPVVCNERTLGSASPPYVGVDNVGGAAAAVRHLVGSGRRRIATIAGPQDMVAGIDRLAGYRQALGDGEGRSLVETGDFTAESGEAAMRLLWRFAANIPGAAERREAVDPRTVADAARAEREVHAQADQEVRHAAAARVRQRLDDAQQLFGSRLQANPRTGTA